MSDVQNLSSKGWMLMLAILAFFLFLILVVYVYQYNFYRVPGLQQ